MRKEAKKFNTMKELSLHIVIATISILILIICLPTVVMVYKVSFVFAIMGTLLLDFYLVVSNHKNPLKFTKIVLICLLLGISAVGIIFYISKFLVIVNSYGIERILTDHITTAKLLFFLICLFQPIILPLPEAITIPAGSAVIGAFSGAAIGFLGSTLGIVIMYFLARIGGYKLVSKLVKEKHLKKYQEYVLKNETIILTLMFIVPILPDEIICVGAGISKVSLKKFIVIAAISKLITSSLLSYSVYLAKVFSLTTSQIALMGSILLACILSLSFIIKRLIKRANSKEAYVASQGE
ncbi:TVP38/TMEM64 family protein [Gottfriedia sp. NPDC056225]|uniref:TVP38/TMEM64 family protein n=1 Tax=Gottfriedia sp. NPDC056225 TaxID=3345751 RepID=UPI001558FF60|nr:VTT domain-containing protein [Arthrobacter citreus]